MKIQPALNVAETANQPLSVESSIPWEKYSSAINPYRQDWEKLRDSLPAETPRGLGPIWTPAFRRGRWSGCYLSRGAESDPPVYGESLTKNVQAGMASALFGVMAYHVERETVLSLGARLTELGEQELYGPDGAERRLAMNLQERPDSDVGKQALVTDLSAVAFAHADLTGLDRDALESALIGAFDVPGAVTIKKSAPDAKRRQHVIAEFAVPETIAWDGNSHRVRAEFTVKLPKPGGKSFNDWLTGVLGLVNGRPAQHYQDEAAVVIRLEEALFADKKSVRVTLDPGTGQEKEIAPDRWLGKTLALLLTQTAGGFFERRYFQSFMDGAVLLTQLAPSGNDVIVPTQVSWQQGESGGQRVTAVSPAWSPYKTEYVETPIPLADGSTAFELKTLRALSTGDGSELVRVDFNAGHERGVRDLGRFYADEQHGRFAVSVAGESGFSYGEFTVTPTRVLSPNVYYTAVVLTPRYPYDMRRKKIILHVVHGLEGVTTETQVVPMSLTRPPGGVS